MRKGERGEVDRGSRWGFQDLGGTSYDGESSEEFEYGSTLSLTFFFFFGFVFFFFRFLLVLFFSVFLFLSFGLV